MEKHTCRNCMNLDKNKKEELQGRLRGHYRYGCSKQANGYMCGILSSDDKLERFFCDSWDDGAGIGNRKLVQRKLTPEQMENHLQELFDRWNSWKAHGSPDSSESDGIVLNRLRLAIIGAMRMVETKLVESEYPECYYSPIPPEMEEEYMANPEQIKEYASRMLSEYRENPEYHWLVSYVDEQRTLGKLVPEADIFFSYENTLEQAIGAEDFLTMKQKSSQKAVLDHLSAVRKKYHGKRKRKSRKAKMPEPMVGQIALFEEKVS